MPVQPVATSLHGRAAGRCVTQRAEVVRAALKCLPERQFGADRFAAPRPARAGTPLALAGDAVQPTISFEGGTKMALFTRLWRNEEGQDLAEYALLIALIALVVIGAVTLLGTRIQTVFNNIANALNP
jgi:pilus assembly protein Flp/PilA